MKNEMVNDGETIVWSFVQVQKAFIFDHSIGQCPSFLSYPLYHRERDAFDSALCREIIRNFENNDPKLELSWPRVLENSV